MPREIVSPLARWPGKVQLSDPLTFPQYAEWSRAAAAALEVAQARGLQADYDAALLPGILACVERWELAGVPSQVTPATFPATPRKASAELIRWLQGEITRLITEEDAPPPKA